MGPTSRNEGCGIPSEAAAIHWGYRQIHRPSWVGASVSASSETTLERLSPVLPKQSSTNPQLCSPGASAGICGSTGAQYANEPVTTPEFRTDEITVRAQCFAQGGDLNFEVLVRHNNARPHPFEELLLRDERAVGLQQDQEEVESATTNLDR